MTAARRGRPPRPVRPARRDLLRLLPAGALGLGALGLAGCVGARDAPGTGPSADPSASPAAPSAAGGPAIEPTPTPLGEQAPAVDPDTLRLPLEMLVMIVVEPGWTARPAQLDGIFLGGADDGGDTASADDVDGADDATGAGGARRLTAVDQDGTALWTAQAPSGQDAVLSRDSGARAVAVLPGRTAAGEATLTGVRLRTGEVLWGPVVVPGAPVGPGLLLPGPDGGDRAVLDAGTGETLLAEDALDGGRLLAEHLGTALHTDGGDLVARTAGAEELWRLPLPDGIDRESVQVRGAIDTLTHHAVLVDGAGEGLLVDLLRGRLLAEHVTATVHDPALGTTVVAAGRTVRGLDAEGAEIWRHRDPEALVLLSAGERLAYAQRPQEGTLVVLDTARGQMVNPYDVDLEGPLAVPELFSAEAATSVYVEETRYLVTTTLDEAYGLRD
ncbi:hypothetical protein [Brachybacterium saurashtrense]|uniref:PQQ-binding-like beta-propeller repeat protein n=1 Tax=Brachybacterium saurashtrense TaxID=556288 RepID=A0A345YRF0_9MICO|nr:hypothetical protein [Brachybacterium saurashtrense]AXK46502.1 hypothetical protein DWV08_13365 [Brachybacterium saurashtrense]RRR24243.1 hypothetical protein DXU92_05115 [Brachybacterium saurashtrense]